MAIPVNNNYGVVNESSAKDLVYVLEIEGLSYIISSDTIFERIKYGDLGITYGLPGLVYGGLIPFGGFSGGGVDPNKQRSYLNVDKSGMTLSQKVEPWEGKSSVSTLNFVLTDKNEEMLQLISPGVEIDEILLKRVSFYIGYRNVGFPEDFVRVYRGFVSSVNHTPGLITLGTSDANLLRRQTLFAQAKTALTSGINASVTTIPVIATDNFYTIINAPGSASPEAGHSIGIRIDDEIMTYTVDPSSTQFTGVTRGALGTIAAVHDADAEVTPAFYFEGNPLLTACKLQLSGWNEAHSETAVQIARFVSTGDSGNPTVPNSITFIEDIVDKYGLVEGDFISVTGATNGGNNVIESSILSFFDVAGAVNRGMIISDTLINEPTTFALASFRSQFEVYPREAGLKMKMIDVDTARHIKTSAQFVTTDVANLEFTVLEEEDSGKTFIEKELYVPIAGFSLTRQGKMSVVITAPPLPLDDVTVLTKDNVVDAEKAVMQRAVNNRKFYNRLDISQDYIAIEERFPVVQKYIDSDSLNQIPYADKISIESKGLRTANNSSALIDRINRKFFERYAFGAQTIQFKVDWKTGALLEAGDVVQLQDNGELNFPDLVTGKRGLTPQLWEVLEKSTDLKSASTSLTIINGLGSQVTDRFGVISPSSEIESGATTTSIRIKPSFGELFGVLEYKKWESYIGLKVNIHSPDFSNESETTFVRFDDADNFKMILSPALNYTPALDDVIELAFYSSSTDPQEQIVAKISHASLSPVDTVTSGASNFVFDVSTPSLYWVGGIVVVHKDDYSVSSGEVLVTDITGNTITVGVDLGFTPDNTYLVTFIGFSSDETQTYRWYS